ncbi:extracellular solute-binding protein [Phycisphaerales bacterium AB-hyl4]|uniref:Extracellular solute-binding protein n=1 Tax=Natronomicrosphaera hydrolytica TaxID=3242702 RepID=A0ABV4U2K9_9BACT
MRILQACRYGLGVLAVLITVWAFVHVGVRTARDWGLTEPAGTVVLTVLHYSGSEEAEVLRRLLDRFEAEHPHIRIRPISAPDYYTKLQTMFAGDAPPDVFYLNYNYLPQFAEHELLLPIDDFVERERNRPGGEWVDDFYPQLLDAFRYDGHQIGTGPLFGLPKDFSTTVMYVNLDLFERAGLPVPYDGWTWDEYEQAMQQIAELSTPGDRIYGGVLVTAGLLRNIVWSYGGEFFGTDDEGRIDFHDLRLHEPGVQSALEMVRRTRFEQRSVFNATGVAQDGGELFYSGRVGAIGPLGRWMTPRYRAISSFDWDVVPMPHETSEASIIFTVAWVAAAQTEHPEEAFEFIRYLSGPEGQALNAELGLAIPALQSLAESDAFLDDGQQPSNTAAFLDALSHGRLMQNPPQRQFEQILESRMSESLQLGRTTPAQAAAAVAERWDRELASPLRQRDHPLMPWTTLGWVFGVAGVVGAVLVVGYLYRTRPTSIAWREERAGYMFVMPWIAGFVLLTVGPVLVAAMLSFTQWSALAPLETARFVGLDNFRHMVGFDGTFVTSVWVTLYFTFLVVPVGQVLALAVALLMHQNVPGIAVFRTIYFVPSVVTGVALATLWLWIFNTEYGLLNNLLSPALGVVGLRPPDWFGVDAEVWAVPAFVLMSLWGVGGAMIIYLAGLKSIPMSLYEAARVDGASPIRQFFAVTLPMLSPLIFFNLVMGLIGSFQVFTHAYVMTGGGPGDATRFYVLNLYQQAFELHNMGYASALAWVLFIFLGGLTMALFYWSRRWVYYESMR